MSLPYVPQVKGGMRVGRGEKLIGVIEKCKGSY